MKFICICFLAAILINETSIAQHNRANVSNDSVIRKWRKAVVNIECMSLRADQENVTDSLWRMYRKREIDFNAFNRKLDSLFHISDRMFGTAIYLKLNGNRFLLTARHVLHDPLSSDTNAIVKRIMIVPNGSAPIEDKAGHNGMDAAAFNPLSFKFSSINDDLGIIALDHWNEFKRFADFLDFSGYRPITINDISSTWNYKIGDSIMNIGFPDFSKTMDRNLDRGQSLWKATRISLPVVTYGRISDTTVAPNRFSGEIFFYHGNSGGAIICRNKLIGIVSGFIVIRMRDPRSRGD